jgi:hypothetical protein
MSFVLSDYILLSLNGFDPVFFGKTMLSISFWCLDIAFSIVDISERLILLSEKKLIYSLERVITLFLKYCNNISGVCCCLSFRLPRFNVYANLTNLRLEGFFQNLFISWCLTFDVILMYLRNVL